MAAMIISRANMQLASKVREQIFFTLADHLTFAIERSRKGIAIQNRLLPEVRRFYPQQFRVASDAVTIIRQQYGIELPEEEAGNIAFHLVNGQSEGDDVAQTMQSVKMLKDIFNLVQYHFKQQIDTESINYSRFLVHMQFFLQRLQEGELDDARDSFLLVQVIKEYPEAYRCALRIRDTSRPSSISPSAATSCCGSPCIWCGLAGWMRERVLLTGGKGQGCSIQETISAITRWR